MISIVMTYFNRQPQLLKTLDSFKQYDPKDFFVVIVDDGSPEPLELPPFPFKITKIRMTDKNWTQGDPAWNAGIKYALSTDPDIIIIQNAECYHHGNILKAAKENVTDKNYIVFGCYSQGKGEEPGSVINDKGATADGESAWYCHPVHRAKPYHYCSAITVKNMIKLNGFDERFSYGAGYDDDDLLQRIGKFGLEVYITTEPIVIHQWHEHTQYPFDERTLVEINFNLFQKVLKENTFRARHTVTEDL